MRPMGMPYRREAAGGCGAALLLAFVMVLSIVVNLGALALGVYVVVWVLRALGVL